jgi:hypothetical protein
VFVRKNFLMLAWFSYSLDETRFLLNLVWMNMMSETSVRHKEFHAVKHLVHPNSILAESCLDEPDVENSS